MWNLFGNKNDERENDYNSREHQDTYYEYSSNKQYCPYCDRNTEFKYDRCTICKNN